MPASQRGKILQHERLPDSEAYCFSNPGPHFLTYSRTYPGAYSLTYSRTYPSAYSLTH